jgi:MFS family permease
VTGPWAVLAITLAIQALVSLAVLATPAMAPAVAAALHAPASLVGAYVAIVYVGAMVASLVSGPLVIRYGAMRVSQVGLLSCALGLLVLALSSSLGAAVAGALLVGVGYGPITPASSHLLAKSTPPHRAALMFSIKQTGVPVGGVLAGLLVPPLVLMGGVDAALYVVAAGCVLCMLVAQPAQPALDADREPGHRVSLARLGAGVTLVMRHPVLRQLAAFSFVFSAMQMALASFLVTYFSAELSYTLLAAGVALSIAQVGGVVGRVIWGYVADRWLGARAMLACIAALMAVCAVATAAFGADAPKVLVFSLLFVFGASATGWNGVYLAEVARLAPAGLAGAATGGSLAITFLGVVLGPLAFGGISASFGTYRAGYIALAIPTAYCAWQLSRKAR